MAHQQHFITPNNNQVTEMQLRYNAPWLKEAPAAYKGRGG
jgi:hypothetical protein